MPKSIIIDTGSVFSLNPNEEVLEGIESILKTYCAEKCDADEVQLLGKDVTYVATGQALTKDSDRSKQKLTIKLFLYPESYQQADEESQKALVNEAIAAILQLLSVGHIDSLILSIQDSQIDQIIPVLKTFWSACEAHKAGGKINELGTSDLNRDQLRELFQAAKVKPSSSQINLDACCDIPEELSAFSKQNDIKLLTHNDPLDDYVPIKRICSLLDSLKSRDQSCKLLERIIPSGSDGLKRLWIARYTSVLSGQGVILGKGYLVSLASSSDNLRP